MAAAGQNKLIMHLKKDVSEPEKLDLFETLGRLSLSFKMMRWLEQTCCDWAGGNVLHSSPT